MFEWLQNHCSINKIGFNSNVFFYLLTFLGESYKESKKKTLANVLLPANNLGPVIKENTSKHRKT